MACSCDTLTIVSLTIVNNRLAVLFLLSSLFPSFFFYWTMLTNACFFYFLPFVRRRLDHHPHRLASLSSRKQRLYGRDARTIPYCRSNGRMFFEHALNIRGNYSKLLFFASRYCNRSPCTRKGKIRNKADGKERTFSFTVTIKPRYRNTCRS